MTPVETLLQPIVRQQEGAITRVQALAAGATARQLPVHDLACVLTQDDLVCLIESALKQSWGLGDYPLSAHRESQVRRALEQADVRSESVLETRLRLLLRRAGLAPEVLQLRLFDRDGICYARLDFAWPSCWLAVEADGREHHEKLEALLTDRQRQNKVTLAGWTILRFTWYDIVRRPAWVIAQVREALTAVPTKPTKPAR